MVCCLKQMALDGVNLLKSLGYIERSVRYPSDFIYERMVLDQMFKLFRNLMICLKRLKINVSDKIPRCCLSFNCSISSPFHLQPNHQHIISPLK